MVHNGEISSYDANRRYVEQFGYDCELQTDTEVITYLFDLLSRRHGLTPELAAHIMTAPAWDEIDAMEPSQAAFETALRTTYASALVNGPFSVILGSSEGLLAINDRLKLRALMAAEKGSMVYMASEQAAIELVCPDAENMRAIGGGEPFVVQLDSVAAAQGCCRYRRRERSAQRAVGPRGSACCPAGRRLKSCATSATPATKYCATGKNASNATCACANAPTRCTTATRKLAPCAPIP